MRFSLPKNPWHRGFVILALVSAVASFCYFFFYPEFAPKGRKPAFFEAILFIFGVLFLLGPIVIGLAFIWPHARVIAAAQIHLASFLSFVFLLTFASGSPGHSSPGAAFAFILYYALFWVVIIEIILVIAASSSFMRRNYPVMKNRGAFWLATAALLGGWGVGVFIWGILLAPQVIYKAEAAAAGRAYCIEAADGPVSTILGLTAFGLYSGDDYGWTLKFHGLMVIEEEGKLDYKNWSYRYGQFVDVSEDAREGLHLDKIHSCKPVPHFAMKI